MGSHVIAFERPESVNAIVGQAREELAAARALLDLAHKLLDAAATAIERVEGHSVEVYS